jgi:Peptidase A4 family
MITRHKLMRRRVLPLVVGAALAAGGVFAADATGASTQSINAQQEQSQNWSGYVVQSSSGQSFSSVSASWVQPTVEASSGSGTGYSAYWVGLGGSSEQSQALEQVGTAADITGGQTTYYAWYELVPSAEQKLNLAIHPGDHMSGKVTVSGNTVTVSLSDQTTGKSTTKTLQMTNPDTSSAEWIAEAPAAQTSYGSYSILPLADFGSVTFTNASATAGGHTGSLADPSWTVQRVDMTSAATRPGLGGSARFSPAGVGEAGQSAGGASAGGVSSNGTSFTVTYSSGGTAQSSGGSAGAGRGFGAYPRGSHGYPGYGGDPGGYAYGGGYPGVYGYRGS